MNPKECLARLREIQEFRIVLEAVEKERPLVHPMSPNRSLDEQATKMLFESGQQSGFDLLMNYLRGNSEWQNRNK